MNHSAQRRVGVIALALALVLTPGCTSGPPTASGKTNSPAAKEPTPTATPSPAPTPTADAGPPSDLTFESAETLDPSQWIALWPALAEGPFPTTQPDDGKGSWAQKDKATGCTLFFYEGTVTDLDASKGDKAMTDQFLTVMLSRTVNGSSPGDIAKHAYDDTAPRLNADFKIEGDPIDMRTIWLNTSDGGTALHTARMFRGLGGGVYLGITCPPAHKVLDEQLRLYKSGFGVMIVPNS